MRPCGRKRKSTVLRCVALIPQKGVLGKLPNPVREHSYNTRPFYLHPSFLRTGRTHAPLREKKKSTVLRCVASRDSFFSPRDPI